MRKIYKLHKNDFAECEMKEIKAGDKFKMNESTGEPVKDKYGEVVFTATSDAYRVSSKIYKVDIE